MGSYNKHIIIVGSARSGTSWLSETMAKQHRYRLLFEPDHEFQTTDGKLLCDKLITAQKEAPEAHKYLRKVFKNRVDNDWIAQSSNRKWKRHLWPIIPKFFVIKFVRANLMSKYMNETFGIPVIHMIRNPFDVIASQQRVKFPWLYDLSHFQAQDKLVKLVKDNFDFDLQNLEDYSKIEKLTLRWCLENIVALKTTKITSGSYRVVRHEDLRADMNMYLNLCNEFGLQPISDIKEKYNTPSSKTHPKSEIRGVVSTDKLTENNRKLVTEILKKFQMKNYDDFNWNGDE